MEAAMENGQGSDGGEGLAQVVERFRRWRDSRVAGARVPAPLWDAAVVMAKVHGVQRMSKELGLDDRRLKRRMELAGGQLQPPPPQPQARFVEMFVAPAPAPAAVSHECVVELQNTVGATMRVHLQGAGLGALAGACSAFLSASWFSSRRTCGFW